MSEMDSKKIAAETPLHRNTVRSLDRKWKEFLYAFAGFGPNFMMILMGAYFTDAINPAAMGDESYQVIMNGTCFILPGLFPILYMIAKAFDGLIDIPFAHITDTISTKWGRRRPTILVCMLPMILAYAMCWWPVAGPNGQALNTVWIVFWALVFFSAYTMCMITFYGSLSTVCADEGQRLRVSGYKSFFDTITYCAVYALVPVVLGGLKLRIDDFVFLSLPLMFTIAIPLFMIKEGEKYGYPERMGVQEKKITIGESLKLTFGNKIFMRWTVVNCCSFFGLQMFLVGMNAMIMGGMGFNGLEMALINTCAFAPVPVMLWFFNKMKAKAGVRFTFQTCLLAFAVAILSFFFASLFVTGGNKPVQYIISCLGSVTGSWAIGAFFLMPLLVPAQISGVEERVTGKNHSAMYFAAQAVCTSIVGAVASSLVYENIKMLFISKAASGIVWAENAEAAAIKFGGVAVESVFNLGTLLVPFIVCLMCLIGFIVAFRMPRDYSAVTVARELKKQDPSLDISQIEAESGCVRNEKGEIIFVQAGLTVLSGFLFGFIWTGFLLRSIRKLLGDKKRYIWQWLACCFVPFAGIFVFLNLNKRLKESGLIAEEGLFARDWYYIAFGCTLPLMPLNIMMLARMQASVNGLLETVDD